MRVQTAQKVELARALWYDGAAASELMDERRRIGEVAEVLGCVLENAVAIFEKGDDDGWVKAAVWCRRGDGVSVVEWV
jgi:hypothetical protein